jgi:glutaredoxin 3
MYFEVFSALMVVLCHARPETWNFECEIDNPNHTLYCDVKEKHQLILYYAPYCPYSQKVIEYLHKIQKQIPLKNLNKDPQAKAELKNVGGKLQVPCLVIDGKPLYESDDIIDWISKHRDELPNT